MQPTIALAIVPEHKLSGEGNARENNLKRKITALDNFITAAEKELAFSLCENLRKNPFLYGCGIFVNTMEILLGAIIVVSTWLLFKYENMRTNDCKSMATSYDTNNQTCTQNYFNYRTEIHGDAMPSTWVPADCMTDLCQGLTNLTTAVCKTLCDNIYNLQLEKEGPIILTLIGACIFGFAGYLVGCVLLHRMCAPQKHPVYELSPETETIAKTMFEEFKDSNNAFRGMTRESSVQLVLAEAKKVRGELELEKEAAARRDATPVDSSLGVFASSAKSPTTAAMEQPLLNKQLAV